MQTVLKSKNRSLSTDTKFATAGGKDSAIANKAETAGVEVGQTQMKKAAANAALTEVTNEERHQLIAEAAYFRAERRNFVPGHELEDWLDAEVEIETKLHKTANE